MEKIKKYRMKVWGVGGVRGVGGGRWYMLTN